MQKEDETPKDDNTTETEGTTLELKSSDDKGEGKVKDKTFVDAIDFKWLRRNNYETIRNKFSTVYVLQHIKRPDKIAEIRAANSFHACKLIHWKPNQVRLLEVREGAKKDVMDIDLSSFGLPDEVSGSTSVV